MTARLLLCAVVPVLASACITTSTASSFSPRPHREVDLVTGNGEVRHKVEKGQTLYRIAKTYGLTVDELMTANKLDDPRELKIGEELLIPGAHKPAPKVVEADSPEPTPTSRSIPVTTQKPPQRTAVKVGKSNGPLSWPLRGVLYARFGRKGKEPHDGIDLAAPAGTPVKTAAPGTTLYAGEQKGYGLIVIVEHQDGFVTLYAHNRDVRVKTGQKVRDGQVVATVGDSGKTTGPHLHFEVRRDGKPLDPLDFLGPVPAAEPKSTSPNLSAQR